MPLSPTAKKEIQIAFVNDLEAAIEALIDYAQGDENALAVMIERRTAERRAPVVPPPAKPTAAPEDMTLVKLTACPRCNSTLPGHETGGVACVSVVDTLPASAPDATFTPIAFPALFADSSDDEDTHAYEGD